MAASFPEYATSLQKKIRKCRKKIRQIEGLEVLKRNLSSEEQEKVLKKADVREELLYLISEYESNTSQSENKPEITITSEDSSVEDYSMKRTYSNDTAFVEEEVVRTSETELIQFSDNVVSEKVPRLDSTVKVTESTAEDDVDGSKTSDIKPDGQVPSNMSHSHKVSKMNIQSEISTKKKSKPKQKLWTKVKFNKKQLTGHSDLVLSVDCDDCYIISSSRDTTVKIWNSTNGEEINDLRGHTGAVSSVILLSANDSKNYLAELPIPPEAKTHRLAITGSTDCSIRIWSIISGKMYKSIYTYNGVSAIVYISSLKSILSGTDGGKLELWDAITGYNYQSLHVAEEEIKSLKVLDDKIYCGTADCILSIYTIRDKKLSVLFTTELEFNTIPHYLMSLSVYFEQMFCGDDHPNLKVITWKSGRAHVVKFRNVKSGYGTSDALCVHNNFLISSSFDLDTGDVSLNIRKLPSSEYLYSVCSPEENVGRILSIAACDVQNSLIRIITGGQTLNMWECCSIDENSQESDEHTTYHNVIYQRELTKPAIDSDNESEPEKIESDEDETSSDGEEVPNKNEIIYESAQASWYDKWCTIL